MADTKWVCLVFFFLLLLFDRHTHALCDRWPITGRTSCFTVTDARNRSFTRKSSEKKTSNSKRNRKLNQFCTFVDSWRNLHVEFVELGGKRRNDSIDVETFENIPILINHTIESNALREMLPIASNSNSCWSTGCRWFKAKKLPVSMRSNVKCNYYVLRFQSNH